jgi:hypothetical protein
MVLPDTTKSFEENVANNKAALPPRFLSVYVADEKLYANYTNVVPTSFRRSL